MQQLNEYISTLVFRVIRMYIFAMLWISTQINTFSNQLEFLKLKWDETNVTKKNYHETIENMFVWE